MTYNGRVMVFDKVLLLFALITVSDKMVISVGLLAT